MPKGRLKGNMKKKRKGENSCRKRKQGRKKTDYKEYKRKQKHGKSNTGDKERQKSETTKVRMINVGIESRTGM
jgi:hypothetical protein